MNIKGKEFIVKRSAKRGGEMELGKYPSKSSAVRAAQKSRKAHGGDAWVIDDLTGVVVWTSWQY